MQWGNICEHFAESLLLRADLSVKKQKQKQPRPPKNKNNNSKKKKQKKTVQ